MSGRKRARLAAERGSASVAALGLLVLLASAAAGATLLLQASLSYGRRSGEREAARLVLEQAAEKVIRALCLDPSPQSDSPEDPVWDAVRSAAADGTTAKLRDVGSSLNPNWVQKGVLQKTGLGELLRPGRTAEELQQRREDRGPAADIVQGYGDLFREGALERHGTGYGYANINVTDEFVLRKLFAIRTGDEAGAEAFHARIQRMLSEQKVVDPDGLTELLGADADVLYPLLNAEPVLNVHFADPLVLTELLSYPDMKVPQPERAARVILDARERSELTAADLRRMVGAAEESRIWQYLGTVTWFWKITTSRDGADLETIVARIPGDGPPRFQVVEERVTP